jgi:Telomeric repeat-binding factor 2.
MNKKFGLLLIFCAGVFAACQNETESATVDSVAEESVAKTIIFSSGVKDGITRGDKYNYFALEGTAEGYDQVTTIIEGTAVDYRETNNVWEFDYPYQGPSVETKITFTTDTSVIYGDTGIDLDDLAPESYATITFMPNEKPTITPPAFTVTEGEAQNFLSEDSGINELVTVMDIREIDALEELNPLGEKLLEVEIQYFNNGSVDTYIAPNYFSALDGEGENLPLRYTHFWLHTVAPGDTFTDKAYFDITSEGPYSIQFFDGAWTDSEEAGGTGTDI